jgi:hydrogenase maturation protease
MDRKVLILGLGNTLLQDEGLGVRAAERLRDGGSLPAQAEALDGGTLGLGLLPYLKGVTDLLILDAVDLDQPPGSLFRLEGDAIPAVLAPKLSMHQVGLQELLAAGSFSGSLPERVVLLGIQPEAVDWGLDLTPTIEAAMDVLVEFASNFVSESLEHD